jgi:putative DNA primase/helicase
MTAAENIAALLGGEHRSGDWWRCRCPVHDSRGPSLAPRDGERGLIVKCFAGCDSRDVLAEIRRRGLFAESVCGFPEFRESTTRGREPRSLTNTASRNDADRIALATRVWSQTQEARGTPVVPYLADRGITMPVPASLRWAPSLRRRDGSRGPAMVAIVEHVERGFAGVHRTWLRQNDVAPQWHRLDRAMLGPVGGGAVRLAPAAELVMVAEGIETALSAMQATGLSAWAALSTSGIAGLVLPSLPLAATVVILADNDINGAGERAARVVAARWLAEGRQVRIAMPPEPGTDFNDLVMGRAHARIREISYVAA